MKQLLFIAAILTLASNVNAQNSQNANATASQTVQLGLSNALEIKFGDNNSTVGNTVSLPFTTINDYINGVESSDIELKIRSNKEFTVSVKTSSNQFTYTGNANGNTNMPVTSTLGIKVSANATGGNIGSSFSATSYNHLNQNARSLLQNCDNGGNQTFAVKYKATPGFNYPAGTYTTEVIYTATQQ